MAFEVIRYPLNNAVPAGGSFSVPYPTGRSKSDFGAAYGHLVMAPKYGALRQPKVTFDFLDDAIVVTNATGVIFDAGTMLLVQVELFVATPTDPTGPTDTGIKAGELVNVLDQISQNSATGQLLATAIVRALGLLQDEGRLSLGAVSAPPGHRFLLVPDDLTVIPGSSYGLRAVSVTDDIVLMVPDQGEEVQLADRSLVSVGSDGRQFHPLSSFVQSTAWTVVAEAATITLDLATNQNFEFTLTASRILDFSNYAARKGTSGLIKVKQDATGGRGLTISNADVLASPANGGVIVLNSGASEWTQLAYVVDNDGKVNVL